MAKLHSTLYRICGFILLFGVTRVSGVKIRKLEVPEMAQAGHEVHLLCDYDLERARLYQVKWYKGTHEFYRYSPREEAKLFLVENLDVDLRKSDDRTVVLKNLHVDMTGSYTCEVSTEGFFETALGKSNMTVIKLPKGGPHIQGYRIQVRVGDTIQLNCTSLKSRPAAELHFWINDRHIKPRSHTKSHAKYNFRRHVIVDEESNAETALLSMAFKVRRNHIRNGKMKVMCTAKIKGMWNKNRTEIIYEAPHRDLIENLPDGGLPSAASGASSSSSNLATVNVISIFGGHGRNTQGSVGYEDSFSGVPPANRGILVFAILLNAILLQLFGSSIIRMSFPTSLLPVPLDCNMKDNKRLTQKHVFDRCSITEDIYEKDERKKNLSSHCIQLNSHEPPGNVIYEFHPNVSFRNERNIDRH